MVLQVPQSVDTAAMKKYLVDQFGPLADHRDAFYLTGAGQATKAPQIKLAAFMPVSQSQYVASRAPRLRPARRWGGACGGWWRSLTLLARGRRLTESAVCVCVRACMCACLCVRVCVPHRTAPHHAHARVRVRTYWSYIARPELTAQLQVQLAAAGISLAHDVKMRVFSTKAGRSMASLDFTDATMRARACQVVPGLRPDVKEGANSTAPIR